MLELYSQLVHLPPLLLSVILSVSVMKVSFDVSSCLFFFFFFFFSAEMTTFASKRGTNQCKIPTDLLETRDKLHLAANKGVCLENTVKYKVGK